MRERGGKLDTNLHHLQVGALSLNRLRYGGDVVVAPAVPEEDNFLITLPLRGKARFHYGSECRDVESDKGAIIGPYRKFRFEIDGAFDQIVVRLDRRRVESVCTDLTGLDKAQAVHFELSLGGMPDAWYRLLEAAASLAACTIPTACLRLSAHLEEMLIETLLLVQPNSNSARILSGSKAAPSVQIRRAMDYMLEHISEPVRLGAVARHCGMSLRNMQAGFHRDLGVAPGMWLRARRLECAHHALVSALPGSISVTDVALQCGFFHFGDFAARFKARFGEKPSDALAKWHR